MMQENQNLMEYKVWDRSIRWFHWINVLSVVTLIAIGLVIFNSKALGVSTEGKILLKTWHVYVGYVFTLNLVWRLLWAFIGNRYSRWSALLPFGKQYKAQKQAFIEGIKSGRPASFKGHNPIARWMVSLLLILLTTQAVTGLVLAGTDVYMPPFGGTIKAWVADSELSIDKVQPYSKEGIDEAAYEEMRDFRKPFITTHEWIFYVLIGAIILHLIGVVVTELRERNGIVSAMFTGRKVFNDRPEDD